MGVVFILLDVTLWIVVHSEDIEVDIILTIHWWDKRLSINPNLTLPKPWIRLGDETSEVWRPTLMFRNCKKCLPLALGTTVPMYVKKVDAMLWAQQRVLTKFGCNINLRAYPMDIQNCPVLLYTNDGTDEEVILEHLNPDDKYIQPSGGLSISEFYIPHIEKKRCIVKEASGYRCSCIEVNVPMQRLLGYHLITSFAPTTFIVVLSWISFWIPVDAVPARIALGLTSLLTLATRLDQAQKDLPPVSYIKAIDIWIFTCISMVSISLIEFSVSFYRFRVGSKRKKLPSSQAKARKIIHVKTYPFVVTKETTEESMTSTNKKSVEDELDGTRVDRMSRIGFPLFFLVFNIVYWSYYLTYYY